MANPKISGFIDFGDSVHTQTINDLAIALAYAIMSLPDPLSAALEVVKGYNKYYKISGKYPELTRDGANNNLRILDYIDKNGNIVSETTHN